MKVLERSPDRLVLEDNPVIIGLVLVLVILVCLGVGLARLFNGSTDAVLLLVVSAVMVVPLVLFVRRTRAIFDRQTGELTLRVATLRSSSENRYPLASLSRAEVETSRSVTHKNRKPVHTYRPVLIRSGSAAPLPLNQVYASGPGAEATVRAVNDWLGARG